MNKVRPSLPEYDLRHSVLGHIQRGGSPTVVDRVIATRMGNYAVELLMCGKSNLAVGVKGDQLVTCSISKAIKEHASPNLEHLKLIETLRTK
jgi:6-phosphofructokinase 1